jgi:hypothetical protein
MFSQDGGATIEDMVRNPGAAITAWLVIDDETVITGDATGDYYLTTRYGRRVWDNDAISTVDITDFAMSPNYDSDATLICGDEASQVFISTDGGEEWDEVSDSDIAGFAGAADVNNTYVCFDPRYADNMLIYAVSDDIAARCEIDPDEDPGDLEFDNFTADAGTPPALTTRVGAVGTDGSAGIVCADDGMQVGVHEATLYISDAVDPVAGTQGSVWRCLNPADGLADVVFEQAEAGLTAAAAGEDLGNITGAFRNLHLSYGSNVLWFIDLAAVGGIPDVIMTYEDTLAAPVVLSGPANGAGVDSTSTIAFSWEDLNADTVAVYNIQVNEEEDFPGATDEIVGTVDVDGVAAADEFQDDNDVTWRAAAPGTTYYWRVRVGGEGTVTPSTGGPLLSRWSEEWAVMTEVAQVAAPIDVAPAPGAQDVITKPSFDWRPVDGAEWYEVEVATDGEFTNIVTAATPAANVWAIDVELDNSTVYYWRVRGISADGAPEGDWVVSIFTTEAAPAEAAPPVVVEEAPAAPDVIVETPAPVEAIPSWMLITIIASGAVLVVTLIVLIVRTRRV